MLVFRYLDPKMLINLILDPMNVFFCAILLLINVTSGRIFISKDVLFDESRFHYSTLFTTTPYDPLILTKMFPYHPFPSTTLLPIHLSPSLHLLSHPHNLHIILLLYCLLNQFYLLLLTYPSRLPPHSCLCVISYS